MSSAYDFTPLIIFFGPSLEKTCCTLKVTTHFHFLVSFFQVALNFSSPQQQSELPDNSTIQSFVKDYVDRFVGGYNVICLFYCFEF